MQKKIWSDFHGLIKPIAIKNYIWLKNRKFKYIFVKLLLLILLIFKAKNMTYMRKLKNIIEIMKNNIYLIYVIFEKKNINILLKDIIYIIK